MQIRQAIVALLLAGLLGACDSGQPSTATPLKVYRHSEDGAPSSLDPAQAGDIYPGFMASNLYDTLYSYRYLKRPYELKPNLAAAMPEVSDDGLNYTIRLKPGVRYVDDPAFADGRGRIVTAQDFVYSIQRHFHPEMRAQGAWLWQGRIVGLDDWKRRGADFDKPVEGLKALDAQTLQLKLTRPYPQLVYLLAMGLSAVVPREAVEKYGRGFALHPVGSGPFRLASFNTTKAVLLPNPNYRREPLNLAEEGYDEQRHGAFGLKALDGRSPPFVDRVEIDWISEPTTRWASFTKGSEIQYTTLPPEHFDTVLATRQPVALNSEYAARYHSSAEFEAGLIFEVFNLEDAAIGLSGDPESNARNRALRCAIVKGFDWEARNQRYYGGIASAYPGVITPAMPEFDPALAPPRRDLPGAQRLLGEAGWTPQNLPVIEESIVAGVIYSDMHEQFRGMLQALGWPADKIRVRSYATFGDFSRAFKNRQLQIFPISWTLDYPDAENTLGQFYGPNESPGSNHSNYHNAEYDRLFEQAAVLAAGATRTALYRQMNRMLIDDCVGLYALSRKRVYLWHNRVLALPDRELNNGFWLKYVDLRP